MTRGLANLTEVPSEPIPLSVLTGFLGSGKTTLLSRVLDVPDLRDTAVLISEFGAIALDHAFTDLDRDANGVARVELRDPDQGPWVSLWVDESYPYLMVFSGDPLPDVRRRSLAVEPMTCPPNAFRTGVGLIRLEPGAAVTSTWGIASGLRA